MPGSDGNYPLMSSIFDGFHSTSGIAGFQIANCTISSTGAPHACMRPCNGVERAQVVPSRGTLTCEPTSSL